MIGVEPEARADADAGARGRASRSTRRPAAIAADSLAPRRVGELMFPIAQAHVARVVLVQRRGHPRGRSRRCGTRLRVVAEPGGAAAFAALLERRLRPAPGERVGVLVSGGNTTAVDFGR